MTPQPNPEPGQVWQPSVPGSMARLVTAIGPRGLHAALYPLAAPHQLSTYYPLDAWQAWVAAFRAAPTARAGNLAGDA